MSEVKFKTSSHSSKIWILLTMQRFKLYDTFVYAQFYEILDFFFRISSGGLLEQMRQWVKVWKRKEKKNFKSHIAQSKHLNTVSLPIYREPISSFFLVPVEKHFLNFSFSLSYFSRCIFGKLLPLSVALNFRLAIRVTFQVIFFDWLLEWFFKSYFRVVLEWLFKLYKRV